jgi:hypothetical protein
MLDTFIKNRGTAKTIIHNNNRNKIEEMSWDADYDGKVANVSLDLNSNGKKGHYDVKLTKKDLAKLLNVSSVDKPIDKRLKNDFKKAHFNPDMNVIYLDDFMGDSSSLAARYNPTISLDYDEDNDSEEHTSIAKLLQSPKNTHISSPLTDEELIIPLTVDKDSEIPSKHYKKYPVYKRHIKSTAKGLKKGNGKTRGNSRGKGKTRRKHRNHEGNLRSLFNL